VGRILTALARCRKHQLERGLFVRDLGRSDAGIDHAAPDI